MSSGLLPIFFKIEIFILKTSLWSFHFLFLALSKNYNYNENNNFCNHVITVPYFKLCESVSISTKASFHLNLNLF